MVSRISSDENRERIRNGLKAFLDPSAFNKWFSFRERPIRKFYADNGVSSLSETIVSTTSVLKQLNILFVSGKRYRINTNGSLLNDIDFLASEIYKEQKKRKRDAYQESKSSDLHPKPRVKNRMIDENSNPVRLKNVRRIPSLGDFCYSLINEQVYQVRIIGVMYDNDGFCTATNEIVVKVEYVETSINSLRIKTAQLKEVFYSTADLYAALERKIVKHTLPEDGRTKREETPILV